MLPPGFYCERLAAGPWGEPLNAWSNLGFLLAAGWAWRRVAPRAGPGVAATRLLAALLALVGLASLSFHTLASSFTQMLDVAFIGLFNLAFLVLLGTHALGWSRRSAGFAALAFIGLDQLRAAALPPGWLYGSSLYLPPLLVLLLLTVQLSRRHPDAARLMAQAAAVFTLSLGARTLDRPLCPSWPWGLHFVWHLLNAWVLLCLLRAFAMAASSDPATRKGVRNAQDRP